MIGTRRPPRATPLAAIPMAKPPLFGNQLNTKTIIKGVAIAVIPIPIIIKEM